MSDTGLPELTRVHADLQQLHRELVEQRYVRRADTFARVTEAVRGLGEVGSPSGIIDRAAEALALAAGFEVVLLSGVDEAQIRPLALWVRDQPSVALGHLAELRRRVIPLRYPLVEAEVAQRHEPQRVSVTASGRRAAGDLAEVLGWTEYCVADIAPDATTIGLLHAAHEPMRSVDDIDRDALALFAGGLAQAFERAVLREQVQRQLGQLSAAAQWIGGRMLHLSDGPLPRAGPQPARAVGGGDVLTPRELDVLRLIARGHSNAAIGAALAIGEGTVKYHVKNLLRKMQARSRAEAVSKYVRYTGGNGRGP